MQKWILGAVLSGSLLIGLRAETTNTVFAAERIVVTATKTPVPIDHVGSSVSVVTGSDIERYQLKNVVDAVQTTPGISFNQSGGPGQQSSLYIRGSKAEHVKIFIDGIPVNDPTSPVRQPDLAHLTADDIEQIEILRGPQSTLYGSDAIGGVINIRTKHGEGPPSNYFDLETGSYRTLRTAGGSQGGNDFANYCASISRYEPAGFSALKGGTEDDGYKNTTIHSRVGITPSEYAGVDFVFRHVDTKGDYDGGFPATPNDPSRYDADQTYFRTEGRLSLFNEIWEQKGGLAITENYRDYSWGGDYAGKILHADWQNNIVLNEKNTLTAGTEWENEDYKDSFGGDYENQTIGLYLQDQFNFFNRFFTTAGIRHEEHEQAGNANTYRLTSAYLLDETGTKLKTSLGTGFRSPSLYQLHDPYGGNPKLRPEKSLGGEIGLEQNLIKDQLKGGVTWFQTWLKDTTSYDNSTYSYVQSANVETKGFETFLDAKPTDNLKLNLNYTYLLVDDKDPSAFYERRKPKHEINARADFQATEKLNLYLSATFAGERNDGPGVTLDKYLLLTTGAGFQLTKNLLIYGRVENLTNEKYELVDGYGTAGISAYAGTKLVF